MKKHAFILLPLLLVGSSVLLSNSAIAPTYQILSEPEKHEITIGDRVDVPERTLTLGQDAKVAKGQIFFPDGSARSGKSFIATQPGLYKVEYSALFGKEEVKQSVEYICNRHSKDLFNVEFGNISEGHYSHEHEDESISGAILELSSRSKFVFKQIIDFNTFDSNQPFFEFIVDTSVVGASDLSRFLVRLTDVDDEQNYVDLTIDDSGEIDDAGQGCYILAGSSKQRKTGYEGDTLHVSSYGTNVYSSFRALPRTGPANTAKLYFDYAEKKLFVSPLIWSSNVKTMITDLDDRSIQGSNVWEGFTNGKAELSVSALSLNQASAKVVVTSAGTMDLSRIVFEDNEAPVIDIDYGYQSEYSIPNASVNKSYPLFKANIVDNFDEGLTYSTRVTYDDVENSKRKDISVKNGAFVPTKAGKYIVTYSAKDYSGNKSEKTINVFAVDSAQQINASLSVPELSTHLYEEVAIPSINDVNVSGGSGNKVITRTIIDPDGQNVLVDVDALLPEKLGKYHINYFVNDYIGNTATVSVDVDVKPVDKPIFIGEAKLPNVIVKGHKYIVPKLMGVETDSNQILYLDTEAYVNGTQINGEFIAEDTCEIVYKLKGKTGESQKAYVVPVINPYQNDDKIDKSRYFYGNFDEVNENENDVTLTTNHDASFEFANTLPYDLFEIFFEVFKGKDKFESFDIKLIDGNNNDLSLTFHIKFIDGKIYVFVPNDATKYDFFFEEKTDSYLVRFRFDNTSKLMYGLNTSSAITEIKRWDNGEKFDGFNDGIKLVVSLSNVSSLSSFKVTSIDNQEFGHRDVYMDDAAPIIIFNEKFKNEQELGDNAFLPTVKAFDVLGDANATVSAKYPDGKNAFSNKDASVSQTFALNSFGSYQIIYSAVDSSYQRTTVPRKINVYDNIKPVLEVEDTIKENYKLNDAVTLPAYKASDNLNDYTLDIFLRLPNGEQRLLLQDHSGNVTYLLSPEFFLYNNSFKVSNTSFRVEQKGKYTLRYFLYDEAYNSVEKIFTFIAE